MERPISPPRVTRRGTGTTRYEKEIAGTPKLADDPNERKWVGPWLLGDTIGKGASGRVRLAKHKRTRQVAAMKIIPKVHLGASRVDPKAERVMQSIRREMVVMKLIHHPHVMDMYDVYEDKDDLYLLLEYVEGGELFDYLVSKGRLDLSEAISYFRQIISGVHYCHKFHIAHRDLKPENLLLDKDKNIKIADFGMAALEYDGTAFLETSCGSPHYASPEVVAGKQYHGSASDIWSCGVVLFALLTGRLPFDHENMGELLRRVKGGKFEMPRSIPPEAKDLLSKILKVDPAQRIKMEDIIRHPFFNLATNSTRTKIIEPRFPGAGRVIPSEQHIDRAILENLVSLFRKMNRTEIIAKLLAQDGGWEKSFYFLLKEYQERQSEEYGHGMNFVEFTGREEPTITKMHRKRLSQNLTGPTGTIRAHTYDPGNTVLTAQQSRAATPAAAGGPQNQASVATTPPRNSDPRRTEDTPSPVATRNAPSPKDHTSRRRQPAVSGPRPHTSHKENNGSVETPLISSSEKRADDESVLPTRPDRNSARPIPLPAPVAAVTALLDTERKAPVESFPFPMRQSRPRAYTVGAESNTSPSPQTPNPNARLAVVIGSPDQLAVSPTSQSDRPRTHEYDVAAASVLRNQETSSVQNARPVSALVGLGLELPTPPPLMINTASPQLVRRVTARDSVNRASLVEHPATNIRPLSAAMSPRTDMPPPLSPRASKRMSIDVRLKRRDSFRLVPVVSLTSSPTKKKGARPQSLLLNEARKSSELVVAGYPSPPPSQPSSLEPLLALQQSPVFSERFSLHLDAMLMKPPKSHSPMELDDTEEDGEEDDEGGDQQVAKGEPMDIDEQQVMSSSKRRSQVQVAAAAVTTDTMPVGVAAPLTARLVEKRARADTGATMMMGDWSFLGEAEEARQAVPFEAQALKLQKNERPAPPPPAAQHPSQHRQDSADSNKTVTQSTPRVPLDRHASKKVNSGHVKANARRSTFVAGPPSPALTPTLTAVQSGWFAQFFRVKPAAYAFHSLETFVNTRTECALLLRSFGVSVEDTKNEGKYGILRCHVDYVQEDGGKMIVNKPITFRAQITPHFTVRSPNLTRGSYASTQGSSFSDNSNGSRIHQHQTPSQQAPPAETCTLSLIQEHGAKSTLEVIAARFRQEWRLDTMMLDPSTPRTPATPRGLF